MGAAARAPRRWPLVVAAVAVVVVLGGAATVVALVVADAPGAAATSAVTPSSLPSMPAPGVTGCQAGQSIGDDSLLQARSTAPSTTDGAVAFAADVFRWLGTDPTPDQADQLAATIEELLAPDADASLRASLEAAVDAARQGRSGDNWTVSTVGARYYVESSTPAATVVSVTATRVFDDGTQESGATTFTLIPAADGWHLQQMQQTRSSADVQAIGTPYQGGC